MTKRKVDYPTLCKKIKRWRMRAKRAITMLDKLERQKERMEKEWAKEPVTITEGYQPSSQPSSMVPSTPPSGGSSVMRPGSRTWSNDR